MSMAIKAGQARATGDPGLLGAIGGALKGGFTSLVTGGNPLSGAIRGAVTGSGYRPPTTTPTRAPSVSQPRQLPPPPSFVRGSSSTLAPVTKTRGVTGMLQRAIPGGATGYQVALPAAGAGGGCENGYHLNRSGYYTHSEGWIPPRSKCVKNRRRNPANPRALDRAIGRLDSAKRLQHKLSGYSTAKYTASGRKKD